MNKAHLNLILIVLLFTVVVCAGLVASTTLKPVETATPTGLNPAPFTLTPGWWITATVSHEIFSEQMTRHAQSETSTASAPTQTSTPMP